MNKNRVCSHTGGRARKKLDKRAVIPHNGAMSNYFYNLISREERLALPFVSTTNKMLARSFFQFADRVALRDGERVYTYQQLAEVLANKRHTLYSAGVRKGDTVGVLLRPSLEQAVWVLAVLSAGATLVTFPSMTDEAHLLAGVRKFEMRLLVSSKDYPFAREAAPLYLDVLAKSEGSAPMAKQRGRDRAVIIFTGGTTGDPKGAVLSHHALMRGALNGIFVPHGEQTVFATALPFSHVLGLVRSLLTPLFMGAENYISNPFALLRDCSKARPTIMVLVPGLADVLLAAAGRNPAVLGDRLECILCGGAPVPRRISEGFEGIGVHMYTGYGMTESANSISAGLTPLLNNNSVGRLYPKQRLRFRNGEIQLKGDNLFEGYYRDKEATKKSFTRGGWFRTGDVGYMDKDGHLHITGRIKNIILLPNGENIYPEEIEESFNENPSVRDCMACEDTVNGEPVIALEILPAAVMADKTLEELYAIYSSMIDRFNRSQPSTKKIGKLKIRTEDFERSISMKIKR